MAVKHNQPTLHQDVIAAFADNERDAFAPEAEDRCQTFKHNRGRNEQRARLMLGPQPR